MIIAYVSKTDKECYADLRNEFTDVKNFSNVDEFINFYAASKNRDILLIYRVDTLSDIEALSNVHFSNNIYIIVVGQDDIEFSLLAGKIGVDEPPGMTALSFLPSSIPPASSRRSLKGVPIGTS